ncbi:metallophosphoesterase family protein [Paenibacillus sp. y28]|uniref:metallophosphoesterase family protein n=1 Tax=Paenibacillus sp. y28 TaxID=3129110 RepID=UPI00301A136B
MKNLIRRAGVNKLTPGWKPPAKRARAAVNQVIRFGVVGDSHVGYGNSLAVLKSILPSVVSNGNKRFVIFGGDNAHAGANHGNFAAQRYSDFKQAADSILGPRSIPYKASIGNWETTTRPLFRQYLGRVTGEMNFPGTRGRVRYVWLDNASGSFSQESLRLLKGLDHQHDYIIDFHWPLRVQGITVPSSHVLSQAETDKFFNAIPASVRSHVLAIFTHHAHKFYQKTSNIYIGFPKTKFYVCGCSGAYKCTASGRGYYDATLTFSNNRYSVRARAVNR